MTGRKQISEYYRKPKRLPNGLPGGGHGMPRPSRMKNNKRFSVWLGTVERARLERLPATLNKAYELLCDETGRDSPRIVVIQDRLKNTMLILDTAKGDMRWVDDE